MVSSLASQNRRADHEAHRQRKRHAAMVAIVAACAGASFYAGVLDSKAYHTSILTGRMWVQELLNGNPERIRDQLGMRKHVFKQLIRQLFLTTSAYHTRHIDLSEQVAIFLYTVVTNLSNRKVAERFQRSGDTVSKCFHHILNAITSPAFYNTYVKLPDVDSLVETYIADNPKLFPFFKDAIGALDGTHILARPSSGNRARYRNRKGALSQNVLAACTFDMRFSYVLSGWEGSAADSEVFQDARCCDFHIPEGKYYLADAGYAICDAVLVPFRGVRYHLREWEASNLRPVTYKELYNLRHAQARNIIERIFGVTKKHFAILRWSNDFSVQTQAKLVPACAVVHNFIRTYDPSDDPEPWVPDVVLPQNTGSLGVGAIDAAET